MNVGKNFAQDPASKTEPPGVFILRIINSAEQRLEDRPVRFAYLDEFERLVAVRDADAFSDKSKFVESASRSQVRRCFLLAQALRDGHDVDVRTFLSEAKASAGEVALRRMAYPAARDAMKAWSDWMEKEHLTNPQTGETRPPNAEEQAEMEDEAAGE